MIRKSRALTLRLYSNRPKHKLILNWLSTVLDQTDKGALIGPSIEESIIDYINKTCTDEVIKQLKESNYDNECTHKLPRNIKNHAQSPSANEQPVKAVIKPVEAVKAAVAIEDDLDVFDNETSSGKSLDYMKEFARKAKESFEE